MQKKMLIKYISVLVSLLLIFALVTSCNKSEDNSLIVSSKPSGNISDLYDPFGKYDETVTLTMGRNTVTQTNLPKGHTIKNNNFLTALKERLNIEVKYEWLVDSSNVELYNQKVSLAIVSGRIPDVMLVLNRNQLRELINEGLVEDLSYSFENYCSPLLQSYYDSYDSDYSEATLNNKLYAIPNLNIGYQHGLLWVREDWMSTVGANAPSNLDEILDLAREFIEKDPGNNGAGKTIGILGNNKVAGEYNRVHQLDPIFASFNSFPRSWVRDKSTGKYIYGTITPETKKALIKISEIYAEGLIDKEFAIRSSSNINELITAGRVGMTFGPWWMPFWPLSDSVKNNPNSARWIAIQAPLDENGYFNAPLQNRHTAWLVVRKGYNHPEALIKGLNLMYQAIRWLDEDLKNIYPQTNATINWSVWPFNIQLDYNDAVPRGHEVYLRGVENGGTDEINHMAGVDSVIGYLRSENSTNWPEYAAWYKAAGLTKTDNTIFCDFIFPDVTEAMVIRWDNLQKLESEMFLAIIMGEKTIDFFDDFVEDWKKLGGEEITYEVNLKYK